MRRKHLKWATFLALAALIALLFYDRQVFTVDHWRTVQQQWHQLVHGHYTVWDFFILLFKTLDGIWHYQIVTIEKEPIAVANIVIALVSLVLGVRVADTVSALVRDRALKRFELESSIRKILEKITYYFLLSVVILIVLDISNVPLTAFKFVGGALAIGLGFGSQNVINNFISGLIMMVERPIRIGDTVEVNNTTSTVVNIGARCTQLRTSNNIDILVPNSQLLDSKIVNWTLSGGGVVRTSVSVAVALTNDPSKVEKILLRALAETPDILKDPSPKVYLISLSDGQLTFKVHFWIDITETERWRIVSNLHHLMMRDMRREGVEFYSLTPLLKTTSLGQASAPDEE